MQFDEWQICWIYRIWAFGISCCCDCFGVLHSSSILVEDVRGLPGLIQSLSCQLHLGFHVVNMRKICVQFCSKGFPAFSVADLKSYNPHKRHLRYYEQLIIVPCREGQYAKITCPCLCPISGAMGNFQGRRYNNIKLKWLFFSFTLSLLKMMSHLLGFVFGLPPSPTDFGLPDISRLLSFFLPSSLFSFLSDKKKKKASSLLSLSDVATLAESLSFSLSYVLLLSLDLLLSSV